MSLLDTPGDLLVRGVAGDYRVAIARTTETCMEAGARHGLDGAAWTAMARGITSLALVGITDKEWTRLSAQWLGAGAFGSLHVDLVRPGHLRASLSGAAPIAPTVSAGMGGRGRLVVIRQSARGGFVQGQVELATAEIDTDLEASLRTSDQIASALRVFDGGPGRDVVGVLIQALPGASAAGLTAAVTPEFMARTVPSDVTLAQVLAASAPSLTEADWMVAVPLRFACPCSRARIEAGVSLLGLAELDSMIAGEEVTEARCEFCATVYHLDVPDLVRLRDQLASAG